MSIKVVRKTIPLVLMLVLGLAVVDAQSRAFFPADVPVGVHSPEHVSIHRQHAIRLARVNPLTWLARLRRAHCAQEWPEVLLGRVVSTGVRCERAIVGEIVTAIVCHS